MNVDFSIFFSSKSFITLVGWVWRGCYEVMWHCFFLQLICFLFLKLYHTMVGTTGGVTYDVGDMWEQKSVLKEGESPGVILPVPGNPFHRLEIHPQADQTLGFIAGGRGGVCSYWILTGNTEEGAPERPMHSNTNLIKHRSAAPQVARYNFRKQIFQKMWPA